VKYATLRLWVREADAPEESEPVTPSEGVELRRLRQEVRELRMERDILKKPLWTQPVDATIVASISAGV
jgi:transposase-like protein